MKISYVYPEKDTAVVYTQGCNFSCWFCNNKNLIPLESNKIINFELVKKYLLHFYNKGIKHIIIAGGEPTIQKGLEVFIDWLKTIGYKITLYTNGTNPNILKKILPKIDYISMTIVTSFTKYEEVVWTVVDIDKIKTSINLIMNSAIDYDFNTTLSPDIDCEDIEEIALYIKNAKKYILKKCLNTNVFYTKEDVEKIKEKIKPYLSNIEILGY